MDDKNLGDVSYYQTQALTRHGCFKEYLKRFKKKNDAVCEYCLTEEDDANYTLFVCMKFADERESRMRILNKWQQRWTDEEMGR